jgi:soluble lytic murein transglycosylase-like protein
VKYQVKEALVDLKKYFKPVTQAVLGLYLLVAATAAPFFLAKWMDAEDVITYQQQELHTAVVIINKLQATKEKIISCANNQQDHIKLLINMERKYKMSSGILQNVAYEESRYNPNAISHKGALGIMQIHPKWHKNVNPYDPYEAIPYGAKYLHSLYERFGDWEIALAAWNWGQGNMSKYSFKQAPRETKNFVKNVLKNVIV